MSQLKIEHSKKLNYYTQGSSTFLNTYIFNAPNNEYDLLNDPTQKLYVIPLDEYYADVKKEQIDGKNNYTVFFKRTGTARFKIIYEYTNIFEQEIKEIEIVQFVCYERFFVDNYRFLITDFDYNLLKTNTKFKVIIENIFEMFDILYAYASDVQGLNNPFLTKSKFLETLGRDIGFERIDFTDIDTSLENISNNLYRALLGAMSKIIKLKGTPLSYQLFFNTLGYDITIKEYWWDDISRLVEIDTSNPINESSFDLYSADGVYLGLKSQYDPRTKIQPNNSRSNAKSNFIAVQLSALLDNLGVPVDYAPSVQSLSIQKKLVLKQYLEFLRPQHIAYINDIIKFSLQTDGENYELLDFLDLITENLTVEQLLTIGGGGLAPVIKAYRYFDLIDLEDELFLIDWTKYFQVNNEKSFDVFFNVPIQPTSSQVISNYTVKRNGVDISADIVSCTQVNQTTVRITFLTDLTPGVYEVFHTGIYSTNNNVYESPSNIIQNPIPLKFRLLAEEIYKYTQYGSLPATIPFNLIKAKALVGSKIEITFNNNTLPFYPAFDKLKDRVVNPTTTTLSNFQIKKVATNAPLAIYAAAIHPTEKNKIIFDVANMDNLQDYEFKINDPNYIHTNNLNNFFAGPLTYTFVGIAPGYNEDGIALPPEPPVPTWQEDLEEQIEAFKEQLVQSIEDGQDIISEPVKWNQFDLNWGDADLYWGKSSFFEDFNMIKKKLNPVNTSNPYDSVDIDSVSLFEVTGVGFFTLTHILTNDLLSKINEPITKDKNLYYEVSTKKINILRTW